MKAGRARVARRRLSPRPFPHGRNQESAKASFATFGLTGQPSRMAQGEKEHGHEGHQDAGRGIIDGTAAVVLIAGCSNHDTTPPPPSPWVQASPSSSAAPSQAPSAPPASSQAPSAPPTVTVSSTASPAPSQSPSAPAALGPCSDSDLEVTNGALESADTQRRVVVSFRNMSSHPCTLIGYPGADLVTPGGGVLINVSPRPAAAAHHLTLDPGDVATADVQAYAIEPLPETRARAGATWSSPRPTTTYRTRLASICPFATRLSAQWTQTYLLALNCG